MDEAKGRKVAIQMGIPVMGTVGVMLLAYESGILSGKTIKSAVDLLRNANRHISGKLFEQLLDKISKEE